MQFALLGKRQDAPPRPRLAAFAEEEMPCSSISLTATTTATPVDSIDAYMAGLDRTLIEPTASTDASLVPFESDVESDAGSDADFVTSYLRSVERAAEQHTDSDDTDDATSID
jgi:hypothetical protein